MSDQPDRPCAGTWLVARHSGRTRDSWRPIYCGTNEVLARQRYTATANDLRQGGVRLYAPDGELVAGRWAPRLRTRW